MHSDYQMGGANSIFRILRPKYFRSGYFTAKFYLEEKKGEISDIYLLALFLLFNVHRLGLGKNRENSYSWGVIQV